MNGEILQTSDIVISARKALFESKEIEFALGNYELSICFLFIPNSSFETSQVNSVDEWFESCLQRGLKDIKLLIPSNKDNKDLLGFANTSRSTIVCYWENGKITCFCPFWEFDRRNNGWKIKYTERQINAAPVIKNPHFNDQTDEFKQTLLDIEKFATEIEQPYFSEIFHNAYEALCNSSNILEDNIPKQLPDEFKAIYYAVYTADRFGAMGSWNDSPPYYAHKKGLDKEYDEISNRLLASLRYNLMYVTNECWKRETKMSYYEKKCPNCGATVINGDTYCRTCNTPLNYEPPKQEELLYGIKKSDLHLFIDKNSSRYVDIFAKNEGKKIFFHINWAAMFFNVYWMFYRKMYKYAVIFLVVSLLYSIGVTAIAATAIKPAMLEAEKIIAPYAEYLSNSNGHNMAFTDGTVDVTEVLTAATKYDREIDKIIGKMSFWVITASIIFSALFGLLADCIYRSHVLHNVNRTRGGTSGWSLACGVLVYMLVSNLIESPIITYITTIILK
jgi:predicted RNA-binding Zn-ribbon protein involved in translation (DUF1610 family)